MFYEIGSNELETTVVSENNIMLISRKYMCKHPNQQKHTCIYIHTHGNLWNIHITTACGKLNKNFCMENIQVYNMINIVDFL